DFRRNLRAIGEEEFGETKAQDVTVDRRDLFERPLGRCTDDHLIDLFLLRERRLQERLHKGHVVVARTEFTRVVSDAAHAFIERHLGARSFSFEEYLQNNGPREMSVGHTIRRETALCRWKELL